jgi:hypothetical protein
MILLVSVVPLLLAVPLGVRLASWLVDSAGRAPWVAGGVVACLAIVLGLLPTGLGTMLVLVLLPATLVAPLVVIAPSHPGESTAGRATTVGWLAAAAFAVPLAVIAGFAIGALAASTLV